MKRILLLIAFLIVGAGTSLLLAAHFTRGVKGNSQADRSIAPILDSRGEEEPSSSQTACPGMRECTTEENNLPTQQIVAFPGPNNMTLHGHLYLPNFRTSSGLAERRKFPVMIYNHGSEANPNGVPHLAKLYVDHGFVFFARTATARDCQRMPETT